MSSNLSLFPYNTTLSARHVPDILAVSSFAEKDKWSPVNYIGKRLPALKTKKKNGVHVNFESEQVINRIRVAISDFIREEKEIAPTLSVSFNIAKICRVVFPGFTQATQTQRNAVAHELATMQGAKLVPIAFRFVY